MGWRENVAGMMAIAQNNPTPLTPDTFLAFAAHWPPADRIALARELLVGTGRVVAEPIDRRHTATPVDGYNAGWNAARAAMLGDEG